MALFLYIVSSSESNNSLFGKSFDCDIVLYLFEGDSPIVFELQACLERDRYTEGSRLSRLYPGTDLFDGQSMVTKNLFSIAA